MTSLSRMFVVVCLTVTLSCSAQRDFISDYAGYSWTEVIDFAPDWGGIDMAFLPNGNLLIAQHPGLVGVWSPQGQLIATVIDIRNEVCEW